MLEIRVYEFGKFGMLPAACVLCVDIATIDWIGSDFVVNQKLIYGDRGWELILWPVAILLNFCWSCDNVS